MAQIKSGGGLISSSLRAERSTEAAAAAEDGGGGGDFPLCTTKAYWLNSFQALPRPRRFFFKNMLIAPTQNKENLTQNKNSEFLPIF